MSYIDGFKINVKSEELIEHLERRVAFHNERADYYAKRFAADQELKADEEQAAGYSNSMTRQFRDSEQSHRHQAERFLFMATHVVPGTTYILDEDDLSTLEV